MNDDFPEGGDLLKPWEAAAMFRVETITVARWERTGKLRSIRTPGGARRYSGAEVRALLRQQGGTA